MVDPADILIPLIEEEFNRRKQNGEKILLKTIVRNWIKNTLILIAVIGFAVYGELFALGVIALGLYIFFMLKTDRNKIILDLAEKSPDMLIEDVISREILHLK